MKENILKHRQEIASRIVASYIQKSEDADSFQKGGEGSRGGKVIGHTKSGKAVYESSKTGMEDHTEQDHRDAADVHEKEQGKAFDRKNYKTQQHHKSMSYFHNRAADVKRENESGKKSMGKDKGESLITQAMVEQIKANGGTSDKTMIGAMRKFAQEVGNTYTESEYNQMLEEYKAGSDSKSVEHEHKLKEGSKVKSGGETKTVKEVRGNSVYFEGEQDPTHITKVFDNDGSSVIKKSEVSHIVEHRELIKSLITNSIGGEALSEDDLEKSANTYFEKGGKRAVIGEKRKFGGKDYIKTAQGWRLIGKNKGKHKEAAETLHGKKKDPDQSIHEDAEAIAKDAGISVEEYKKLHPETKKELLRNSDAAAKHDHSNKKFNEDIDVEHKHSKGDAVKVARGITDPLGKQGSTGTVVSVHDDSVNVRFADGNLGQYQHSTLHPEKKDNGSSKEHTVSFDWKDVEDGVDQFNAILDEIPNTHVHQDSDNIYISTKGPISKELIDALDDDDVEDAVGGILETGAHWIQPANMDLEEILNTYKAAFKELGYTMKPRKDHAGSDQYGFDIKKK